MLDEAVQDGAALNVSGEMPATERESFEVVLESHGELRAQVAGLQETVAGLAAAEAPPAGLKARLRAAVAALPMPTEPESLVVTDPGRLVLWVNPAFTMVCGHTLAELQGRKPGHLLQGPATDAAAVQRIRKSLWARRACRETVVNYHKDGTRYSAEVRIAPVPADGGEPLWFVVKKRKVPDAALTG